jgi:uncharacterized Fe-S cluster-containing radical SAM superfamily enzyme
METALEFDDIEFEELDDRIRVNLLKSYYFELERSDLSDIADFRIEKDRIIFGTNEKRARNKFNLLLSKGLLGLKNKIGGRHTIFINRDLGIPLIGNPAFGLVDRNTSLIEVKPLTGCNLSCIFCSVDEGRSGGWVTDFVVEPGYLVEEFQKLAEFKDCELEAHIGTQGEPLLYSKLVELVEGLSGVKGVKRISMDTNGTLLTKRLIDELSEAGMSCLNLSLNAIDRKVAEKMAGCPYDIDYVLEMAEYAKSRLGLLIAPVWVPGVNDEEMPKLVELGKKWGVRVAIQNPAKGMSWEVFYQKLGELEKRYSTRLIFSEKDFLIEKTQKLPKPFRKDETVEARIICDGRLNGEKIAVVGDRNISVPDCQKKGRARIRITRDKHNIFFGRCL